MVVAGTWLSQNSESWEVAGSLLPDQGQHQKSRQSQTSQYSSDKAFYSKIIRRTIQEGSCAKRAGKFSLCRTSLQKKEGRGFLLSGTFFKDHTVLAKSTHQLLFQNGILKTAFPSRVFLIYFRLMVFFSTPKRLQRPRRYCWMQTRVGKLCGFDVDSDVFNLVPKT